ncbi:MAG: hypothetical protein HFF07_08350 [Oscillospiraceae bacterium]|nr:hypothetical protein [Oscillospiraceae bacterium]
MKDIKRVLSIIFSVLLIFILGSCKDNSTSSEVFPSRDPFPSPSPSSPTSQSLLGQWKQINSEFDGYYHGAIINDNVIEIYSINEEDGEYGLYWAGSFSSPDSLEESYSWFSNNDVEKTSLSLLSSWDDTKAFTYENNQISYVAKSQGVTCTVYLEKENWAPDLAPGEFPEISTFPVSIGGMEFLIPTYFHINTEGASGSLTYTAQQGGRNYASLMLSEIDLSDSPPSSQEEIDELKDQIIAAINPGDSEILSSKNLLLSDLSLTSFVSTITNDNGTEIPVYICYTYNWDTGKFVVVYLFIVSDRNNEKYFDALIESATPTSFNEMNSSFGIRPEFKEAMDSYEAFFDEYVAFMQKFAEADNTLSLLSDYSDYMTQYAETMEKFSAMSEEDMSTEEALYYMEVSNRITKKLLESMQ